MKRLIEILKQDKSIVLGREVPTLYVLVVGLVVLTAYATNLWMNRFEWKTATHDQYGFSIEVPKNWKVQTYGEEGYHNLDDLKMIINSPLPFILSPRATLYIFRLEDNLSLGEAATWAIEESDDSDSQTIGELTEITIGKESYDALKREFRRENGNIPRIEYYIATTQGVIVLSFSTNDYNSEIEVIFERMLASLHIANDASSE